MEKNEVQVISADISEVEVKKLIEENYDIICDKVDRLNGYDDFNFRISPPIKLKNNGYTKECENGYVMKIINYKDSLNTEFLTLYVNILLHSKNEGVTCPCPIQNNKGDYIIYWSKKSPQNKKEINYQPMHAVILLEFVTGRLLDDVKFDKKFCYSFGQYIGKLHNALKPFENSQVLQRPHFIWSLKCAGDTLRYIEVVEDERKRSLAIQSIEDFQKHVLTQTDALEQGIIHGDLNKANVVITGENNNLEISGIIDFCDISHSCYLFELAITVTYLCLDRQDDLEDFAASLILGYRRELTDLEINLLKACICARLSQSLIMGLHSYQLHPTNTYLIHTQKKGWTFLEKLQNTSNEKFVQDIKVRIAQYKQQLISHGKIL